MKYRILLVDDEKDILDFLAYNVSKAGYEVSVASDGEEAVEAVLEHKPHLILLDLMMPKMDGVEACYAIREKELAFQPIIAFLTSRGEDYSQVAGFDAGADDYITKPIRPRLLLSKIEALLRRLNLNQQSESTSEAVPVEIDRDRFLVFVKGKQLVLPKKEFELLEFLMTRPGRVFSRDEIMREVWGKNVVVGERTVDVHIRKLREKLGDDYIRTVKGVGYTFSADEKQ
ncbi:MAG: response regulator transcription factor [Bacteroidetes bacterium]|nr:MAG: response regulator transcription factor [Bacteroidota bacterium]